MDQTVYISSDSAQVFNRLSHIKDWERVLLVTGKKSFDSSGAYDYIHNNIPDKSIVLRFSDFENNPSITDLYNGLKIVHEFNPSVMIAIGGGSVIDMGKLIRYFYTHEEDIFGKVHTFKKDFQIPLVAIPTTAGTGSEATHFAVLYDEQKKKHSISNSAILPDYAIINPLLTYNQSPYLTACAGFDALAQAIEAYWNKNAIPESDEYARKAIELIYDTLPKVVANPTPDLRDKMARGAYLAGKAINITKTTAPHAFSYPFTAHYGIPHGHAVSITFPIVAELNIKSGTIPENKTRFLKDLISPLSEEICYSLFNYINSIGLKDIKTIFDLQQIVRGISIERLSNNPINFNEEMVYNIIKKSIAFIRCHKV